MFFDDRYTKIKLMKNHSIILVGYLSLFIKDDLTLIYPYAVVALGRIYCDWVGLRS